MEYVNLFALAGIRTKAELAAWAPATGALVDYLASIDAEEGVLSMKAQRRLSRARSIGPPPKRTSSA